MRERTGVITRINGNMVTVRFETQVMQNEVVYIVHKNERLKSEIIRVRGNFAELQVYEDTHGLKAGEEALFTGELLSVTLGPGMLGEIYDGLQNPLSEIAKEFGFFLPRGLYKEAFSDTRLWEFTPLQKQGEKVRAGEKIGFVREKRIRHYCMVPFSFQGIYEIISIEPAGSYTIRDEIATVQDQKGKVYPIFLIQNWPVKLPIKAYAERLRIGEPLVTKMRLIDSLFPIAKGGTYCIPGPFGAGKTVLQQLISRHSEVDIVIIAACGERAGEVVETLKAFPTIIDPRSNLPLSDRTVIICNTSSMPVAARESSVYTAVTIAEYYRQMGLHVLLLADSTSRWAQAMREMSGRLEEIPGDEAFPAYLESRIASFYERAGVVRLYDDSTGSVTIGGTVSPAGGNFDEPVTQATLKVVGAFFGLSRSLSDARRYPAIDPLISWSKYTSFIDQTQREHGQLIVQRGYDVAQMMKVIGEEGTTLSDYIKFLKADFFDLVFLQQNAFDKVDEATSKERQLYLFDIISHILDSEFEFENKSGARSYFQHLKNLFKAWNSTPWQSDEFERSEHAIRVFVQERPGVG